MATQLLSQYEAELLQEIRQISLPYLPNPHVKTWGYEIVRLFRDSVSLQQKRSEKEEEGYTSVASLDFSDDMNPQELKKLLDIQAQYESKDRLRELEPMQVDFDVIEFEDNSGK